VGGAVGSGQNVPDIFVELIALEPIKETAQLPIPKTGYVVYVLKGGAWTAHPSISEKDRRGLTIGPGTDSHFDGGRIKLDSEKDFHSFTWYPVISKGQ
jgi:hypothetical protein